MTKFRKRSEYPANSGPTTMTLETEITGETPTEAPTSSGELFNIETESLLKAARDRQALVLSALQTEMDAMVETFTDRAVSIVEQGFKDCFFRASQRIRDLQFHWSSTNGGELGALNETIETIALPIQEESSP